MIHNFNIFHEKMSHGAFGTSTINELIEYCQQQSDPIYHKQIMPLLMATKKFRNLADPGPFFSWIRNETKDQADLNEELDNIAEVFIKVKQENGTSELLNAVIAYCMESIKDRLKDLAPEDKIMIYYHGKSN